MPKSDYDVTLVHIAGDIASQFVPTHFAVWTKEEIAAYAVQLATAIIREAQRVAMSGEAEP